MHRLGRTFSPWPHVDSCPTSKSPSWVKNSKGGLRLHTRVNFLSVIASYLGQRRTMPRYVALVRRALEFGSSNTSRHELQMSRQITLKHHAACVLSTCGDSLSYQSPLAKFLHPGSLSSSRPYAREQACHRLLTMIFTAELSSTHTRRRSAESSINEIAWTSRGAPVMMSLMSCISV